MKGFRVQECCPDHGLQLQRRSPEMKWDFMAKERRHAAHDCGMLTLLQGEDSQGHSDARKLIMSR